VQSDREPAVERMVKVEAAADVDTIAVEGPEL
jgi:hypothetical protein